MNRNGQNPLPAVRIRKLESTKVAYYRATGEQPEPEALKVLLGWAEDHGLAGSPYGCRIFGFDNPGPTRESRVYGYEVWLTVSDSAEASDPIGIKQFDGGEYAVLQTSLSRIGQDWKRLVQWRESSPYSSGPGPCLEEHLSRPITQEESMTLDLYLPIRR